MMMRSRNLGVVGTKGAGVRAFTQGPFIDRDKVRDAGTPPPPPFPPYGTELARQCQGTTLVIRYADGHGGYFDDSTPDSPECGYVPTP
jgi:hypothetical protein